MELLESMGKQRHSNPTPGRFGSEKAELIVSIEEGQEEIHEVFLEYRMLL